ncbi:MAG: TRAP transporter small permease [Pigmentiphaga sp.]|nr:TRAP transporter small permease [Pigmentiphaga sp.]
MHQKDGSKNRLASWLAALHDGLSRLGFVLAGCCLALIVCSYCYEVMARYFFSAPTSWVSSLVAYMLCAMVFLAMPELSRQRTHIFISIVLDKMAPDGATRLQRSTMALSALACLMGAAFSFDATWSQWQQNILTVNEWRIPKWMLSIVIPYGLFSSSIYFLRQALEGRPYRSTEGQQP